MAATDRVGRRTSGAERPLPDFGSATEVSDAAGIAELLDRLVNVTLQAFSDETQLCLVGIRRRGDVLAQRLRAQLSERLNRELLCGSLDITLYRDDFDSLTRDLVVGATDIPFSIEGRTVLLIDDVLFTGRTIRAALDEILELGRPARVALLVLIDRGWRELPIAADLVALTLTTQRDDDVQVLLQETDGREAVLLRRRDGGDADV